MEKRLTDPFKQEPTPQESNSDDPMKDLLGSIKNEQGEQKYKDVETALKALQESQTKFIPTLLQEKKELEQRLGETAEELTKRKTLEELTEALKAQPKPQEEPTAATPAEPAQRVANPEVDLDKLLETKLAERESKSQEAKNYSSVVNEITSKYGDKATEHIQNTAARLDTTVQELESLSRKNPKLALSLLTTGSAQSPKPSTSSTFAPRQESDNNPLPSFEKGAARGGMTQKELSARWSEVGEYTRKRLGVEGS